MDQAGPSKAGRNSDSFDFDMSDIEIDDAFLADLDQVEREAMNANPPPASASGSGSTLGVASSSTVGTSSSLSGGRSVIDVITIDDDEEEDEKENVPLPQRHVKRRVGGRGLGGGSRLPNTDVIDISDSD